MKNGTGRVLIVGGGVTAVLTAVATLASEKIPGGPASIKAWSEALGISPLSVIFLGLLAWLVSYLHKQNLEERRTDRAAIEQAHKEDIAELRLLRAAIETNTRWIMARWPERPRREKPR